MISTVKGFA